MGVGFSSSEAKFLHVWGSKENPKGWTLQHTFPTSRLRVRPHPMVGRSRKELEEREGWLMYTHTSMETCGVCKQTCSGAGTGSTCDNGWRQTADEDEDG